ncbi:hypothetical protein PYW07_003593 [Mythimna separata]|uniref:Uncharacterized protein n=1 Tax=Mythimna separata TaxID=271217 RepID=A0AAD8DTF0_MYTSE|nr:hypothetical protein PYW07_003593 [Mythimna separata]
MACTRSRAALEEQAAPRKPKVSVAQLRVLLAAVEQDPSLYNAAESDMISFLNLQKWLDLSDKLNECFDGAMLNTQSWKYVLRYWAENVKKGQVDVMSKERFAYNKKKKSVTAKEARELTRLERRFYNFMKREEAKDIVDVTYTGNFGAESRMDGAIDNGIKVKVQLMNVSPRNYVNDENVRPGPKKRTIHVREDDPIDPTDVSKKLKLIFDETLGTGEGPHKQILENQLDRLQMVSRELEEHIATIQSRIHMIKDLWKHRCGDN